MTERAAYRIKEFAAAIGVDRVTVWRWIKAGKIDTIRIAGMTLIPATVCTPVSARNTAQPTVTQSIKNALQEQGKWGGL